MFEAIRFEAWYFLEEHFSGERSEWLGSKNKVDTKALERKAGIKTSKVYQLSKTFPIFQEDSIPAGELDVVYTMT